MWSTIVAVLGTLAGAALAGYVQRSGDRRAREHAHRQEVARAVAELLEAIVRHREVHWLVVESRRAGAGGTEEERMARATTRSAATVARDRVGLLVVSDPTLLGASETAWRTAVDLHDIVLGPATGGRFSPEVEAALEAARNRCREAHTALRIAGSAYVHAR
jgi:dihydroxyacetone kinase DhaKLM complex PTS-EIIA-like component DhaM